MFHTLRSPCISLGGLVVRRCLYKLDNGSAFSNELWQLDILQKYIKDILTCRVTHIVYFQHIHDNNICLLFLNYNIILRARAGLLNGLVNK